MNYNLNSDIQAFKDGFVIFFTENISLTGHRTVPIPLNRNRTVPRPASMLFPTSIAVNSIASGTIVTSDTFTLDWDWTVGYDVRHIYLIGHVPFQICVHF